MTISLSKSRSNIKQSQAEQSVHILFENVSQLLVVCCFYKEHKTTKLLKFPSAKTKFGPDL